MILTNCNSLDRVDCGCVVSFSSYVSAGVSVLTVGDLLGTPCTFTAYVIDWYKDSLENPKQFTTGKGTDPDITFFHPLTGTNALPVEGGTWIPVIRYVVVGGVRLYSKPTLCRKWCSTLTGLPSIVVSSATCYNGGSYWSGASYTHYYNYNSTVNNVAEASRTIRFDLNSDATTLQFAYAFFADTVADRVTFIYCNQAEEELFVLDDWIVGGDATYNNTTTPRRCASSSINRAFDLPTYVSGDFLKIKITPSIISGNPNTIWKLYLRCMTVATGTIITCLPDRNINMLTPNPASISLIYNPTNCRYECNFRPVEVIPNLSLLNICKYGGMGQTWTGQGIETNWWDGVSTFYFGDIETNAYYGMMTGYGNTTIRSGIMTVSKVGDVLTIICAGLTDYNSFKNSYNAVLINANWTNYTPDATSINHYKAFELYFRVAFPTGTPGTPCGDDGTSRYYRFSMNSIFAWDDTNYTLTITLADPQVNEYPETACSRVHSNIDSYNSSISSTKSSANFSFTTNCGYQTPIVGIYHIRATANQTKWLYYEALSSYSFNYPDSICPFPSFAKIIDYSPSYKMAYIYTTGIFIKLTNLTLTDPLERAKWYNAYRVFDANGLLIASETDYVLVKQVENNIQIFP